MRKLGRIEQKERYRIFKKFRIRLPHLADYLIRTIGIDVTKEKRIIQKVRHGKRPHPRFNKRSSLLLHSYMVRKRKQRKSKKKRHEFAQPV